MKRLIPVSFILVILLLLHGCGLKHDNERLSWNDQLINAQAFADAHGADFVPYDIQTGFMFTAKDIDRQGVAVFISLANSTFELFTLRYETHNPKATIEEFSAGTSDKENFISRETLAKIKVSPEEVLRTTWDEGLRYQSQYAAEEAWRKTVHVQLVVEATDIPAEFTSPVMWKATYVVAKADQPTQLTIWVDAQTGEILGRTETTSK